MDFKTTTAYDIGCQVYVPELYGHMVIGPCIVTNIEINISADRTKISYYINKGDEFVGCFLENKVFRTYEECAEWCEKYN